MKNFLFVLFIQLLLLTGCNSTPSSCEEIEEIIAQRNECEAMAQRIKATRSVVVRTNLEELYEKQCVAIRYYRDGFDDSQICSAQKNQKAVEQAQQALKLNEK